MVKSNLRKKYYKKRELILKNTYAKRIYDLYLNDPHSIALPADQIKQKIRARVTRGTIIYHLNKLKRYGFIPSHKKARKKILDAYFILKRKPKSIVGVENIKQILFHATKMFFEYSYSKCSFALLKEKYVNKQQSKFIRNHRWTKILKIFTKFNNK